MRVGQYSCVCKTVVYVPEITCLHARTGLRTTGDPLFLRNFKLQASKLQGFGLQQIMNFVRPGTETGSAMHIAVGLWRPHISLLAVQVPTIEANQSSPSMPIALDSTTGVMMTFLDGMSEIS